MKLTDVRPEHRPYRPYGKAIEMLYCQAGEVLLEGPAGTGKTRCNLEKIFILCEKYPRIRVLMCRKTRKSMTNSVLVTWEDKVVPAGHPSLAGPGRAHRHSYVFPNGSEIVVEGLDNVQKVMSSEYDIIYIAEAIEVEEGEWEQLTSRLRNGQMPYQQILGDTNPDKPSHWLNLRCNKGQTFRIVSRFEDNPQFYDHAKGRWTAAGKQYIEGVLDKLTGVRHARLRLGLWRAAEGVVYDTYDPAIHLRSIQEIRGAILEKDELVIPSHWRRVWVVDFGYTNPFVWQEWAIDPDGRLYRCKEIYWTQRLVEDHAREILRVTVDSPAPEAVVCDHDAEDRATLEKYLGMRTIPANKAVSPGIQAVSSRLVVQPDGLPRLVLVRDALITRDPKLEEKKLPGSTEEEIDGYVWPVPKGGVVTAASQKKGEAPVKKDDHGLDATRYAVAYLDLDPVRTVVSDEQLHRKFWRDESSLDEEEEFAA
jgi:hypothetical protein